MADIKAERALRKVRRWRRIRRALFFVILIGGVIIFSLCSCSTDDERDLCCERVVIDFRYSRGSADIFPSHIRSTRHYLFDARGILSRVIEGRQGDLQRLSFDKLSAGAYSLTSIGNAGDLTDLGHPEPGVTRRESLLLRLQSLRPDGTMGNGDPIYWGVLDFVAERNKYHRYLCDMSNIHCRLTVTIRWRGKQPEGNEPFTLLLREVPGLYSRDHAKAYPLYVSGDRATPVSTATRVVHRFPMVYEEAPTLQTHRVEAPRLSGRVRAQFLTLRYTDARIPLFRLYRDGQPVMKEIDLSKPFKAWKWEVNTNIEQDYDIEIELLEDGTVIVTPGGEAKVLDWIDGGSI